MLKPAICLAALIACLPVQGAIITGFSGPGAGVGPALNADITAAPTVTTGAVGNNDFTGPGANPNVVTIGLDVFAMNAPFSITFATLDDGTAATDGSTEYQFLVTLRNALNDNGVDPGNAGKEINGLDVNVGTGGATTAGFDAPPLGGNPPPTVTGGGPFPLQFGGIIPSGPNAGGLRFGGLSGGGGGLSYHTTGTFAFSVDLADLSPGAASGPGFLTLTFTANPEPTTMILGSLALIPGGIAVHRRRRKKGEAEQASDEDSAEAV